MNEPVQIDPPGCGCTECLTGLYVPLDRATNEQMAALLRGDLLNATSERFTLTQVTELDLPYTGGITRQGRTTATLTAEYCGRTWGLRRIAPDHRKAAFIMMWTDDSAMWQLIHGQHDTPAYHAAEDYIRARLDGYTQAELNFAEDGNDGPLPDEGGTCILTGTPGEDPDDCTTHLHERQH